MDDDERRRIYRQAMEAEEELGGLGISPKAARSAARSATPTAALKGKAGPGLAAAVADPGLRFADLVEAGLPGGDAHAELAMLYRHDCPAGFLRRSQFTLQALRDPALPVVTARRLLASKPSPLEIQILGRRKDLTSKELQLAAVTGRDNAPDSARRAAYAALSCLPAGWVELACNGIDAEILGMLRNPNCPEGVVRRYVTHTSARIRHAALRAVLRRNLPVESSFIRAAHTLPMTDSARWPRADQVRQLARDILAQR